MIDYERLKLAHELCRKLSFSSYTFDCRCCTGFDSGFFYVFSYEEDNGMAHGSESEDIEDLIVELQELTSSKCKCGNPLAESRNVCDECAQRAVNAVKPKYKIGDEVWYLDWSNNIASAVITKVDLFDHGYRYLVVECLSCAENNLFPTKEALIESQINYWKSMSDEPQYCGVSGVGLGKSLANSECMHERDGKIYLDGNFHNEIPSGSTFGELLANKFRLKCKKCGEFYDY